MPKRYCPSDLPALTAEELRDIWERNRLPDVRDLLWEIARLRQRVASAHYFIALVESGQPGAQMMAHTYLANFGAEPCVLEDIEADYSDGTPGSRKWRGEIPTEEELQQFEAMHREARARINDRKRRR
ncbi:hypothetical protein EM868_22675 [Cupriavidus gilardii]|uniref:hypothetical protein n=1 Tax=Cupriavidus gilardii TaxID=82541 RepID=UPI001EE57867|nr:hypothetical protein [Cupriavidus gilardii]MCG5259716.1 hypothetical protein [Cupriavidus gilardii]MDF9432564.1 hypothetical protein [Cupriavidus gilardii]